MAASVAKRTTTCCGSLSMPRVAARDEALHCRIIRLRFDGREIAVDRERRAEAGAPALVIGQHWTRSAAGSRHDPGPARCACRSSTTHRSGTTLVATPPLMVLMLRVKPPSTGCGANGISIRSNSSSKGAIIMMAFSPRCGVEPCAVLPQVVISGQNTPRSAVPHAVGRRFRDYDRLDVAQDAFLGRSLLHRSWCLLRRGSREDQVPAQIRRRIATRAFAATSMAARPPFISLEPRPHTLPSATSPAKGG